MMSHTPQRKPHVANGSVGAVDLVRCCVTQQLFCLQRMQYTTENAVMIKNKAVIMQQLNSPFCKKLYSVFEQQATSGYYLCGGMV